MVLRRKPWKETSFLLELFSPDLGRITAIAQGARSEKNAGGSEPLAEYEMSLYHSNGPWFLRSSHLVRSLRKDYRRDTVMYAACELYEQTVLPPEDARSHWDLLLAFFDYLQHEKRHPIAIFWRFALHVCHLLGIDLDIERCVACGQTDNEWAAFFPMRNGLVCNNCQPSLAEPALLPLSESTSRLLHALPHIGNVLDEIEIPDETIQQVNRILLAHLSSHFNKPFHFKSLQLYG